MGGGGVLYVKDYYLCGMSDTSNTNKPSSGDGLPGWAIALIIGSPVLIGCFVEGGWVWILVILGLVLLFFLISHGEKG